MTSVLKKFKPKKLSKKKKTALGLGAGFATGVATSPLYDHASNTLIASQFAAELGGPALAKKLFKEKLKKKIMSKAIGAPLRAIPALGQGLAIYDALDIGRTLAGPAVSEKLAKESKFDSSEQYRQFFKEMVREAISKNRKAAKKRSQRVGIKKKGPGFRASRQDILKSIGRKKGGKVITSKMTGNQIVASGYD